jgi:hypothetical protein
MHIPITFRGPQTQNFLKEELLYKLIAPESEGKLRCLFLILSGDPKLKPFETILNLPITPIKLVEPQRKIVPTLIERWR